MCSNNESGQNIKSMYYGKDEKNNKRQKSDDYISLFNHNFNQQKRFSNYYKHTSYSFILLMKFMDKIVQLPKITLRELEERVQVHSNSPYRTINLCQIQAREPTNTTAQDMKITSPFYLKPHHHKEKCQCQYHRMKRAYQQSLQRLKRNKQNSPTKGLGQNQDNDHHERSLHYPKIIPIKKQNNRYSTGNKQISNKDDSIIDQKLLKENQQIQKGNNAINNQSPTRKTFKSLKLKTQLTMGGDLDEKDEIGCKIDTTNGQYISLISQRLQNNKYKERYLKTLFRFIKMKVHSDKDYMWESKAYIQNTLNVLLNRFSMSKLIQFQNLNEAEIKKIANYMNCQTGKVPSILRDLSLSVKEMEDVLSQLRKKRMEMQNSQNTSSLLNANTQRFQNLFDPQSLTKTEFGENDGFNSYSPLKTANSLYCDDPTRLTLKNFEQNKENQSEALNLNKTQSLRKSYRNLIEFESTGLLNKISQDHRTQEGEDDKDKNKKRSIRNSQTNQNFNRSIRNSVLGVVAEVQKQHRHSKKMRKTKHKKPHFTKKYTDLQIDQKYLNIKYQKFCDKRTFIGLIAEVERLDYNDNERAHHIFRQLRVQDFLDDVKKIQDLVMQFQPLFNDNSRKYFMKLIVNLRDKRYIQKLERQLDDMLGEVKKNDPRRYEQDIYQYKEEDRPTTQKHKNIVEFKHHKPQRMSMINKIIYYEANEQIQKIKQIQKIQKLNLQQAQLDNIQLQQIKPGLTQSIYHSSNSCKSFITKKQRDGSQSKLAYLPNLPQQKKVLQYMKRNYNTTFNYLNDSITKICKSLQKDKQTCPI